MARAGTGPTCTALRSGEPVAALCRGPLLKGPVSLCPRATCSPAAGPGATIGEICQLAT
jgi:hypothetical protein